MVTILSYHTLGESVTSELKRLSAHLQIIEVVYPINCSPQSLLEAARKGGHYTLLSCIVCTHSYEDTYEVRAWHKREEVLYLTSKDFEVSVVLNRQEDVKGRVRGIQINPNQRSFEMLPPEIVKELVEKFHEHWRQPQLF